MNLREFRNLLNVRPEEAIELWNDLFRQGLDVNQASQKMGFSWGSVREEIYNLGYTKPKNRLICKENEQGEKIMANKEVKSTLKLTDEEILFLKELVKNKTENVEKIEIKNYNDYKQRSILISESLLNKLEEIYEKNSIYRKQDIFNVIIELGINSFNK